MIHLLSFIWISGFAYVHISALCVCIEPTEVKRGHQISWNWTMGGCESAFGDQKLNLGPLRA